MPNIPRITMQIIPEQQVVMIEEKAQEGLELVDPVRVFIPFKSVKSIMVQILQYDVLTESQAAKNGIIKLHGQKA